MPPATISQTGPSAVMLDLAHWHTFASTASPSAAGGASTFAAVHLQSRLCSALLGVWLFIQSAHAAPPQRCSLALGAGHHRHLLHVHRSSAPSSPMHPKLGSLLDPDVHRHLARQAPAGVRALAQAATSAIPQHPRRRGPVRAALPQGGRQVGAQLGLQVRGPPALRGCRPGRGCALHSGIMHCAAAQAALASGQSRLRLRPLRCAPCRERPDGRAKHSGVMGQLEQRLTQARVQALCTEPPGSWSRRGATQ